MGLPLQLTLAPAAADDDGVSLSQTPGAAGNLTITGALATGGVATIDIPRRVLVTTVSDESAKTLTIYGTDRNNHVISEDMTGPNATTGSTNQDFKTVTRVAVSAAFTGAVKIGTGGVTSTRWFLCNWDAGNVQIGIGVKVSGTVNYTVEYTYDDILGYYVSGVPGNWTDAGVPVVFADPILTGVTTTGQTTLQTPVRAARVTLNSYSASGYVVATFIQSGIGG